MSDGQEEKDKATFKTPKQKEAEEMAARIEECEQEIQALLAKWRMRLTVITIHQDGRLVGLEIKAVPAKSQAEIVGEERGN